MADDINNKNVEHNSRKVIKRLIVYSKPYILLMITAIVFASIASGIMINGATRVSDVVDLIKDGIIDKPNFKEIQKAVMKIIILFFVYMLFSCVQGVIVSFVNQKLICRLREDLELKRQRMTMKSIGDLETGNTLSILTNDVSRLSESFSAIVIELIPAIVLLIGTIIVMLTKSVLLTLSVILSAGLGFILIAIIVSKSQKFFVKQQETLGKINDDIEETFSGMTVVKSFGGEAYEEAKFNVLNLEMRKNNFKAFSFQALMFPLMTLVNNLGYIAVCVVGSILITKGFITFGVIVSFMMYLSYFQEPISKIGSSTQQFQVVVATAERVFGFIDLEEMQTENNMEFRLNNVRGDIEFKDVWFGYAPDKKMIIKELNFNVSSGQTVAIVGNTGAGKTTIINLLLRYYEINKGEITIDGVPINKVERHNLLDQFAVVPQDIWIFNGTIRDNIVLSLDNVTDEKLDEVCRAVGIFHYISTLRDGYDTIIDEKNGLSQGQKQQLAIARAMVADKKIIILDEATSAVDVLLEKRIKESMDKLIKGKTAFIIAHRLSTIENADAILVMKDGNIVEMGTHGELLKKGGFYSELYLSQFDKENYKLN